MCMYNEMMWYRAVIFKSRQSSCRKDARASMDQQIIVVDSSDSAVARRLVYDIS